MMDQRGVAALTVAIIVAASIGAAISVPVAVDAADVNPDHPLYGLERLGERIRMVSPENQMKERWSEYTWLADRGKGLAYKNILEEFTEKMHSVAPRDREAKQEVVAWMQEQMPGIGHVRLRLMKDLCLGLQRSIPATYGETENILANLESIEQELPVADNEMMENIQAHLELIAEQLRQIAEQHENVPGKIMGYFDMENRLTDAYARENAEVCMARRPSPPTAADFENELERFNEKLSEVQAMLEGAPENASGRNAAERLVGVAIELKDNAVAAYGENKVRMAIALIYAADMHFSNAERILEHASEWEQKFREKWASWKETWENMKAGPDTNGSTEPGYVFEPNWWLKPQTFGMFNYWNNTDYARLEAINCTANGYRLVYDFDLKNSEFDYQKDVDNAHERGKEYVIGICFNGIIEKWPEEVENLVSGGACAVRFTGENIVEEAGENVYYFSTNHPLWQSTLIEQGKRIVDLGADGIAVIAPWGSSFFSCCGGKPDFSSSSQQGFRAYLGSRYDSEELSGMGIENLEEFNYSEYLHGMGIEENELESVPFYRDYRQFQRESALEFYKRFVREVKEYARSKGTENFPIAPANHGEWLVPLMIPLLPYSDFAFANLDFEDFVDVYDSHAYEYKLHYSAMKAPLVASPMDASLGWLVQNSKKPEDFIQIKMAEAYANKGAFQDQYQAGLIEDGFIEYSVDPQTVNKINSFYLTNKDLFNLNSQSLAKIAVLLSAKSITDVESEHWSMFKKVSKTLTASHFQYDVLFSQDSDFSPNTLTLEKLGQYEVIILPGNDMLDNNAISRFPEYLEGGGKLIILNQVDPRLSLPTGTSYICVDWEPDLSKSGWSRNKEFFDAMENMLDKRVSEDTLPRDVGIQIWQNDNKIVIHLINYDFDLNEGTIGKENIPVSINLSLQKEPTSVKIFSPDFEEEQILDHVFSDSNLQFVIPELKIWDVLVIE